LRGDLNWGGDIRPFGSQIARAGVTAVSLDASGWSPAEGLADRILAGLRWLRAEPADDLAEQRDGVVADDYGDD
jgi:hypothetical protein